MRQIVIRYMFRVSRLVIIIFSFSYFIGTLWHIFTWLIDDGVSTGYVNFFGYFKFREAKAQNFDYTSLIRVWYWALTTLTSVGYGDLRPVSNVERIITAFIFLCGVAAFSFIMGNFVDMLNEFRTVTAENEDYAGLSKFFGLLARFNKGHPLSKTTLVKIEEYFDYYWAQDLNYAMKSDWDQRFLSELPKEIRVNVRYLNFYYPVSCRSIKTFCSTASSTSSGPTSALPGTTNHPCRDCRNTSPGMIACTAPL